MPRLRLRNAIFDGIAVPFRKRDFDHCFFESSRRDGGKEDFERLPPERLVADIVAKEERILAIMAEIRQVLAGGRVKVQRVAVQISDPVRTKKLNNQFH